MCLGRTTSFSRKTESSPKAFFASERARSSASASSAARAHDAHAAAAAAGRRLDQHRVADLVGEGARRLDRAQRLGRAGHHGHAGRLGDLARRDLVAERVDGFGRRADEDDAGVAALARERRALGQQAVARVDRVDLVALGELDDLVLGQVGGHRLEPLADQVRLVGLVAVQMDAIFLGEDRDRAEPELGRRAEHANRDLAAVGAEKPLERDDAHEPREKYHFIGVEPSPELTADRARGNEYVLCR